MTAKEMPDARRNPFKRKLREVVSVLLLFMFPVAGCAPGYGNRPVGPGRPVTWIGERDSGHDVLALQDITVNYNFTLHPGELELQGTVSTNPHLHGLATLRRLHVEALAVDQAGNVLGSRFIAGTMLAQDIQRPIPFHERVPFPPGAAGLTFRYRGSAWAPGDDPRWDSYPFFN